eukprot:scaffold112691_cov28-Tisochrysis_lutea.AAC.4
MDVCADLRPILLPSWLKLAQELLANPLVPRRNVASRLDPGKRRPLCRLRLWLDSRGWRHVEHAETMGVGQ